MAAILIRGAKQLLTLRGSSSPRCGAALNDLGILQDGAVLILDGVIAQVGPTRRIENLAGARGAIEISASGCVVMPGFVDSHTHVVFPVPGGSAGHTADAARLIRATPGSRIKMRAHAQLESMARHGTTTVEVKTGCGADISAETKILRLLSQLQRDPLDIAVTFLLNAHAQDAGAGAKWAVDEMLPLIRKRGMAQIADIDWTPDADQTPGVGRYLQTARESGLALKIHAEGASARSAIVAAVSRSALSIDHLEHASADDAALLARSRTVATLLPMASFRDGGGKPPTRALIDAGAVIALASNFNPRFSPAFNMQTVVGMACMSLGLSPAEAISAATINGAHALGRAGRIGSIEPGKQADIAILNLPDYREMGRSIGANLVRVTIKHGECIYREGQVLRVKTQAPRLTSEMAGIPRRPPGSGLLAELSRRGAPLAAQTQR